MRMLRRAGARRRQTQGAQRRRWALFTGLPPGRSPHGSARQKAPPGQALHRAMRRDFEPFGPDAVRVDTTRPLEECLAQIAARAFPL